MASSQEELLGLIPKERIVLRDIPRPGEGVIEAFLELPDMAGLVSRAMDRLGFVGSIPAHELPPLQPGKRLVGPAVTVRNVPARYAPFYGWQEGKNTQLGEREAYYVAKPGDVVVIDSGGRMVCSNFGPNSAAMARSRGVVGAIIDGPVTGVGGIVEVGLPVWCRGGTTITGHHRIDTIEINGVIACANLQVMPGDLIVADDSGISVVPYNQIELVLETSQGLAAKGRALAKAVEQGGSPEEIRRNYQKLIVDDDSSAV
jgi:4-hydroxy-4-methyl-2-oxoglutarate aldolase